MRITYFAYGSNMCTARLKARVPSCVPLTTARLSFYRLRFHKRGRDGSAKCNCLYTGSAADQVWGVLFDFPATEKPALDQAEGLGVGYNAHEVEVLTAQGERIKAMTYLADPTAIAEDLRPFSWYKAYVLDGALEHGLPPDYLSRFIESIEAIEGPTELARS